MILEILFGAKVLAGMQCSFGNNCGVYFNNIIIHPNGGVVVGGNYLQTYVGIILELRLQAMATGMFL